MGRLQRWMILARRGVKKLSRVARVAGIIGVIGLVSGCQTYTEYRGSILTQEQLCAVEKGCGTMTAAEVTHLLGPATFVFPYDAKNWYYIGEQQENAYCGLEGANMRLGLMLTFSDTGVLQNVTRALDVEPFFVDSDQTPLPSSHRKEFFMQLFRNVGKYTPLLGDKK